METRIVDAASQVFAARGVDDVRAEDLMQAAGISRRTFYKYFESKEDVLRALHRQATGQLVEVLRAGADDPTPSRESLHLAIDLYYDFLVTNGKLLRHLIENAMRSESLLAPRRRWFQNELVAALERMIEKMRRKKPAPLVLISLLVMLEGLSLHLLSTGSKKADVAAAKKLVHGLADSVLEGGGIRLPL